MILRDDCYASPCEIGSATLVDAGGGRTAPCYVVTGCSHTRAHNALLLKVEADCLPVLFKTRHVD
eukprot:2545683-Amphidinium_carterae.1